MASLDDLTAAVQAVGQSATDLLAKAQATDFQPQVDALNATNQAIQAFLNPPVAE